MEGWSLRTIAEAVDGELTPASAADVTPASVSTDTRRLDPGALFVAIRGERFDGHEFVDEARNAGAVGAIVDRDVDVGEDAEGATTEVGDFALIRVEETIEAFGALGLALWGEATREGLHTVALTGSNGKTTTKELLRVLWSNHGETYATPGNYNNEIGVPITLARLPRSAEFLVLEIGANGPGEIGDLVRLAPGTERLVTSIGYAHTDGFGSLEGVRSAKSEIFEAADSETSAVVPVSEVEKLHLEDFPGAIWTFGEAPEADVRVVELKQGEASAANRVELDVCGDELHLPLGLPGQHNARNLAAAVAVLRAAGRQVEPDAVADELRTIELPGGRWRRVQAGEIEVVDDAYNANPTSVRASFRAFLESDPKVLDSDVRRAAVLGDMLELGDDAEEWHRRIAGELADSESVDAFAGVGQYAEEMAEAALESARDVRVAAFDEAEEVGPWLAERGPLFAWLKASRGTRLEEALETIEGHQQG